MKAVSIAFVLLILIFCSSAAAEATIFSRGLDRARSVLQSAFQLSFLHHLPVIFYRNSFDAMFDHTRESIDNMSIQRDDTVITRDQFQDDKALHVKKSAELALHIKSLIGSAHLAYGITMTVGLIKEALDGSFLNPTGTREKEDVIANHVGAMSVFGREKFDNALEKNLPHLLKPDAQASESDENYSSESVESSPPTTEHVNPFSGQRVISDP